MAQYDINLRDYWRIIRKRRTVIFFTTALLSLFSFVFAKLNEPIPIYTATSAVKFERSRTVAGLVAESFSFSPTDEIATQMVIIKSYPIMEQVAKALKLIDANLTPEQIRADSRLVSLVNGLRSQVSVSQEGDTNIMNITATSTDPKLAHRLANMVARVYQRQMALERNQETRESRQFIESQLKVVEARLRAAEDRVRDFQEAHRFFSVSGLANTVAGELRRLEAELTKRRKTLAATELVLKQLQGIKAVKGQTDERLFIEARSPAARLNARLLDLQLKRDSLLLTFTEEHPEVIEVNRKIGDVLEEMENELKAELRVQRLQVEEIERQVQLARAKADQVPDIGVQFDRLRQQVEINGQVYSLLTSKLQEARIREAGLTSEVTIVRPAFEPSRPVNRPSIILNTIIGGIIGVVVGLVFAFLLETLDTSIGAIEDVEEFLGVPVVGIVPYTDPDALFREYLSEHPEKTESFASEVFYRLVCHFMPRTPMAEAYRALRTNLEFLSLEKSGNTYVVTSSSPGEGKTNTVINLALAFSQAGKRTLLISADLRRPTIYRIFGIERDPGLTDVLLGNNEWRDVVRTVTDVMIGKFDMEDILLTPGLDNLSIMTCGPLPPNPAELLNSPVMRTLLEEVSGAFDAVFLDTPPVLPVTDAAILGTMVHGTIMVYQVGQIARGALRRAKVMLDNVQAPVWGVVLNSLRAEVSPDLESYRYSASYYYYGAGEEEDAVPQGFMGRLRDRLWPFGRARAGRAAEEDAEGDEGYADRASVLDRVKERVRHFGRRRDEFTDEEWEGEEAEEAEEGEYEEYEEYEERPGFFRRLTDWISSLRRHPEDRGGWEEDSGPEEEGEGPGRRRGRGRGGRFPFFLFWLGVLALIGGWLWQEGYPLPFLKARRAVMEPVRGGSSPRGPRIMGSPAPVAGGPEDSPLRRPEALLSALPARASLSAEAGPLEGGLLDVGSADAGRPSRREAGSSPPGGRGLLWINPLLTGRPAADNMRRGGGL
ncbi:MAG: GumC family protein [Nitrospinota bacterium]